MDDNIKIASLAVLALIAVGLAIFFLLLPQDTFAYGAEVDSGTFKDIFLNSSSVYILSDLRGVTDSNVSQGILQCQVDFAGSTGMVGKLVTYESVSADGCVSATGGDNPKTERNLTAKDCFSRAGSGITIYVHSGNITHFYSNGMSVGVDNTYKFGTCGIKRTG